MNPAVSSSLHKDECLANGAELMGPCVCEVWGPQGAEEYGHQPTFMPDWTNRLPSAHPGLQKKSRAEAEVLCSLRRSRIQITTFFIFCMLDRNSRQCLTWLLLIPVHFEGSCPFWVPRGHVVSAASTVAFIIQVTASGSLRTASFHVCIFLCVFWRLCLARLFQWLIWRCTVS